MKDEIRLFVAATLPEEIKSFVQEQKEKFNHPSLRPVPEQNLHLTLFFIGNASLSNLPAIKNILQNVSQTHAAFKLQYLCTESGPNPRSPRLVWARFQQHSQFEKLSRSLAIALSPEENPKQKPIPHITLARYKKGASAPPTVQLHSTDTGISLPVDSISLWRSELASPHPVYTVLETYSLLQNPA